MLGIGAWKDLLPVCPDCEMEGYIQRNQHKSMNRQQQQSQQRRRSVQFDKESNLDGSERSGASKGSRSSRGNIDVSGSNRSGGSSRGLRRSAGSHAQQHGIQEIDEESESSSGSSSSSNDDEGSSSSSEDDGLHVTRLPQQAYIDEGDKLPYQRPNLEKQSSKKRLMNGAKKMARRISLTKTHDEGEYIAEYLSGGTKSQRNLAGSNNRRSSMNNRVSQSQNSFAAPRTSRRGQDIDWQQQSPGSNLSMDNSDRSAGKKVLRGVSKKVSKVKRKVNKSLSNSFTSTAGESLLAGFNPDDLLNHSDNSLVSDGTYDEMYGGKNDYFGDERRSKNDTKTKKKKKKSLSLYDEPSTSLEGSQRSSKRMSTEKRKNKRGSGMEIHSLPSLDSSDRSNRSTEMRKKVLKGVSKKVSKVKRKVNKSLSNSFTSTGGASLFGGFNPDDLLNHSDNSMVSDGTYDEMYGGSNDYFSDDKRSKRNNKKSSPPKNTSPFGGRNNRRVTQGGKVENSSPRFMSKKKNSTIRNTSARTSTTPIYKVGVAAPSILQVASPDVAYQWDRMPLPPEITAKEKAAKEKSANTVTTADETVLSEDEPLASAAAYQWDRMPLPDKTTAAAATKDPWTQKEEEEWKPQHLYGRQQQQQQQPIFPWHAAERKHALSLPSNLKYPKPDDASAADSVLTILTPEESQSQNRRATVGNNFTYDRRDSEPMGLNRLPQSGATLPPRVFNDSTDSCANSAADSVLTILNAEEKTAKGRKGRFDRLMPQSPKSQMSNDVESCADSCADSVLTILNDDKPKDPGRFNYLLQHPNPEPRTFNSATDGGVDYTSQRGKGFADSDSSLLTILNTEDAQAARGAANRRNFHDSDSSLMTTGDKSTFTRFHDSDSSLLATADKSQLVGSRPTASNSIDAGLLTVDDLLQSIQEDVNPSSSALDGFGSDSEGDGKKDSSMPQLDRLSSNSESLRNNEETASIDSNNDLNNLSKLNGGDDKRTKLKKGGSVKSMQSMQSISAFSTATADTEEGDERPKVKKERSLKSISGFSAMSGGSEVSDDESEAQSQGPLSATPLEGPVPLSQLGDYRGGLKIDLSALQAFKQAPKKQEDKEEVKPEPQPNNELEEPPEAEELVIPDLKTFEVSNLPHTGRFGESGMYTGSVSEQYEPHGKGTMAYDNGEIMRGYWNEGELVRESEIYSDEEDDDEEEEEEDDEEEDLNASMMEVAAKRDRSRSRSNSRSRSKDRSSQAASRPKSSSPSPPPAKYEIGDPGKHRDMITDKDEAIAIIEQLHYGDGAFIRRSDGKWTYAVVKSMEETQEGRSAIRFTVNEKNSSKSYGKKYWGTHVRPIKGTKLKPKEREGRAKRRESDQSDEQSEDDRGYSCPPPTQSRLTSYDWTGSVRSGRSRSRSRRRAVSFSPMRALVSIKESAAEEEEEDEEEEDESESSKM